MRSSAWMLAAVVLSATETLAVDTGVGRRAAAVAGIDPTSAVAGSTQIRSFPGQEADGGMLQLFRFQNGALPAAVGSPVNSADGRYVISPLASPLTSGDNVYVTNTTTHAVSSTAVVQPAAAPYILGPLDRGDVLVTGYGAPDRSITIEDAISGATLGTDSTAPGTGAFSVLVPALRMFQAIRAVDGSNLKSAVVTILGFTAATNAGIPPTTCPTVVLQASGPQIIRFTCGLLNPRGVAVVGDGSLRVLSGLPPSGLINFPPPATVRFVPSTQVAEFLSPVTGVGAAFDAGSGDLFIARPRLFRPQSEYLIERHDGELLQMNPDTGDTTVATRLLDVAPTGITADSSLAAVFGGGAVISSLFYDVESGPTAYPSNPTAPEPSAIWSASLTAVEPLRISSTSPFVRIQGLAVGADFDSTPTLFAAQPGSGTIYRIRSNGNQYNASELLTGLGSPVELAFPPDGSPFGTQLYATDIEGGRILKITLAAGGGSTVQSYVTGLVRPFGLAFSTTGLFVTEYSGDIVAIYP